MIGAIVGDIVGSIYEFAPTKSVSFDLFTPWSNFTISTVIIKEIGINVFNNKT